MTEDLMNGLEHCKKHVYSPSKTKFRQHIQGQVYIQDSKIILELRLHLCYLSYANQN